MHTKNKTVTDYLTNFETNVGVGERLLSAVSGGALISYGMKRKDTIGMLLSLVGGGLAARAMTGHCQIYDALDIDTSNQTQTDAQTQTKSPFTNKLMTDKIHVSKSVTINQSPAELYLYWRNFENLPRFMNHLESVKVMEGNRSHWVAKAPLGSKVEWDAEITDDVPNEKIGWKSLEGSDIPNSGTVEFRPTANRGTEVRVTLTYEPPAGKIGSAVAWLFGEEPSVQVAEDLHRFKSLMETGMIITVEGQTSGRVKEMVKAKAKGASV